MDVAAASRAVAPRDARTRPRACADTSMHTRRLRRMQLLASPRASRLTRTRTHPTPPPAPSAAACQPSTAAAGAARAPRASTQRPPPRAFTTRRCRLWRLWMGLRWRAKAGASARTRPCTDVRALVARGVRPLLVGAASCCAGQRRSGRQGRRPALTGRSVHASANMCCSGGCSGRWRTVPRLRWLCWLCCRWGGALGCGGSSRCRRTCRRAAPVVHARPCQQSRQMGWLICRPWWAKQACVCLSGAVRWGRQRSASESVDPNILGFILGVSTALDQKRMPHLCMACAWRARALVCVQVVWRRGRMLVCGWCPWRACTRVCAGVLCVHALSSVLWHARTIVGQHGAGCIARATQPFFCPVALSSRQVWWCGGAYACLRVRIRAQPPRPCSLTVVVRRMPPGALIGWALMLIGRPSA